jgi:hypothetical protein
MTDQVISQPLCESVRKASEVHIISSEVEESTRSDSVLDSCGDPFEQKIAPRCSFAALKMTDKGFSPIAERTGRAEGGDCGDVAARHHLQSLPRRYQACTRTLIEIALSRFRCHHRQPPGLQLIKIRECHSDAAIRHVLRFDYAYAEHFFLSAKLNATLSGRSDRCAGARCD